MNSTISSKVAELIRTKSILVFSKSFCPYSMQVKELIKSLGFKPYTVELDLEGNIAHSISVDDGAQIQEYLTSSTGQKTVPNVFIYGRQNFPEHPRKTVWRLQRHQGTA
ncbi:hypothetical protein DI09_41p60 [Mitosporidium daphniae]|uniref:Glutaredoxin domain-containing protein n=1 Tax=Mitosporidium daphniae TaxID=1485682 RepID=A0A098VQT1_9MICR|nr:uncharacterized protein DI09_41p60 [Mitosporidium daphniae]KGG51194.1 hypothetical protein DI09_41p60 [Mitosporidium daphniae]|eukprot:XP_013237643.1 uncharacterized protein DI09_41p60 [Mitosporidium daphniae]